MANTWFRVYSEFATDPKVQMLSESDQRRLVMLFCFRCNGHVTLQDDEVTFLLRISNEEWEKTKETFVAKGFINSDNELLNWDKRQHSSDTSKDRVAAFRERKKQEKSITKELNDSLKDECNEHVTLHVTDGVTNSNGVDTDTDTDTDTDKNLNDPIGSFVGNENQIPDAPHREIILLYAKHLPMGIQPKSWDGARAAALKTRWREGKKRQDLAWWDRFFAYIAKSDFLTGRVTPKNGKPFEIDLPWILKKENFDKIIDGKYDNR